MVNSNNGELMAFNFSNLLNNTSGIVGNVVNNCQSYCQQQFVDQQYNALGNIYGRFSTYLWALVAFFIIYSLLDKVEYAGKQQKFKFIKWEFDFPISDQLIKVISFLKNVFFMTMFAMSLVYAFFGMQFAAL